MVDIYPSNIYATRFHEIVAAGGYKSRIMIYNIDLAQNPIDVSNRSEVEEYADLLKYKNTDTTSNRRIAQDGIRIDNYYNKDEQYTIGNANMCSIQFSLINDDGFFSSYDWEQTIIVYWDVYDTANQDWLGVPLGVYWWERPTRTNALVVRAKAIDGMSILDQIDYTWPNFGSGLTLAQIYTHIVSNIAGIIPYSHPDEWANMVLATYHRAPFNVTNMTRREVLAKLAEIAGANAFVSRSGVVMLKAFTNATWKLTPQSISQYYEIDGDAIPTPLIKIETGEYTVPIIDKFIAQVGQSGEEYTSGSGSNAMYSINNGFLDVATISAQGMVDGMYGVVSGQHTASDMVAYTPISIKAYADPSVEAGDIIRVVRNNTTYLMPVFQQTLKWNGACWTVEMQNSGTEKRTIPSEAQRQSYVTEDRISTLEQGGGGGGGGADPATVPASASIDANGLITFSNSDSTALFTLQLPIYGGA